MSAPPLVRIDVFRLDRRVATIFTDHTEGEVRLFDESLGPLLRRLFDRPRLIRKGGHREAGLAIEGESSTGLLGRLSRSMNSSNESCPSAGCAESACRCDRRHDRRSPQDSGGMVGGNLRIWGDDGEPVPAAVATMNRSPGTTRISVGKAVDASATAESENSATLGEGSGDFCYRFAIINKKMLKKCRCQCV